MSQNLAVGGGLLLFPYSYSYHKNRPTVIDLPWNIHIDISASISYLAKYHTDKGNQAVGENTCAGKVPEKKCKLHKKKSKLHSTLWDDAVSLCPAL